MKCQIIIIVWNQLQFTKDCLESIILKTKAPFEIILIDNASETETKIFLEEFASEHKDKVNLLRNEENLGFIKAANQGIESSTAEFVCLLNNDTLVSEGWLEELIFVARNNPQIGLLNPSSTTLGQKVELQRIDDFAVSLKKHHGEFEEMAQVSGFCMFIKREVIRKIGKLDEIYGRGYFEDTDYSRRAAKAGFKCARAKAGYVYHYENKSFFRIKKREESFKKNQEIFYERWGKPKRIFIEAGKGLLPAQADKVVSLAGRADWIFIAKEKNINLPLAARSNIKEFTFGKRFFEINCFLKILRKVKKKYDYLFVQSPFLIKTLKFLKFFHKAEVFHVRQLEEFDKI